MRWAWQFRRDANGNVELWRLWPWRARLVGVYPSYARARKATLVWGRCLCPGHLRRFAGVGSPRR